MKKNISFVMMFLLVLSVYCVNNAFAKKKNPEDSVAVQQTIQDLCEFGSFSEVKEALIEGQNVNNQDDQGRTPLMAACQGNSSVEIIQLLFAHGARVNMRDYEGKTALMYAAQYNRYEKVFKELIKTGALVNAKTNDGTTALMFACESTTNPRIVSLLIDSGANINAKDNDGYTVMDYVENNEKYADKIKDILSVAGAN